MIFSCVFVVAALVRAGNGTFAPAVAPGSASLGAEIGPVRASGAGHMIDLRYRVTDADKAKTLFERKTKPYLLDQDSGRRVNVASSSQSGPLRNSNTPQQGRTYVMLFANAGNTIAAGDKVTLVIGDVTVEDLVVQ